nr:lytic transglycosylase domain-containing protein [Treponema sp.]
RIKECFALYDFYKDEDSLLRLCKELYANREYAQVITATENIDLTECSHELAYYRCSSMHIKHDTSFQKDYYKWCTARTFAREQYQLFCEVEKSPAIITLRSLAYIRNYGAAFERIQPFLENEKFLTPTLLSDFGKIMLYGSAQYKENAENFAALENKNLSKESSYFVHFYAGRLYEKALDKEENNTQKALDCLAKAMQEANTERKYDNALWYFLNTSLKLSTSQALEYIEKYKVTWHDPSYFDDFFDVLSVKLITEHNWKGYYKASKILRNEASKETIAKFNYVAARLIQEGFIKFNHLSPEEAVTELLTVALDSGTDIYYRMLAADKLSVSQEKIMESIKILREDRNFTADKQAEQLLLGYAEFGFPEKIYEEWSSYSETISMDCSEKISLFLKSCASSNPAYYVQSLRIASKKFNKSEMPVSENLINLSFPKDFELSVSKYCKDYEIEESLMYALIRSESYFDSAATSSAQAVGLTQLMELTAGDIAKKLKKTSYDIKDSDTNIQFGTFYLAEMIRRLEGSKILALFAYNGGITTVRRWVKNAEKEFGTSIAKDLFLETLPYSETREYGRKVLSAAIMYGILYYDIPYTQTISNIMQ